MLGLCIETLSTDDLDDKIDICKQGYNVNTYMDIEGTVHNYEENKPS